MIEGSPWLTPTVHPTAKRKNRSKQCSFVPYGAPDPNNRRECAVCGAEFHDKPDNKYCWRHRTEKCEECGVWFPRNDNVTKKNKGLCQVCCVISIKTFNLIEMRRKARERKVMEAGSAAKVRAEKQKGYAREWYRRNKDERSAKRREERKKENDSRKASEGDGQVS